MWNSVMETTNKYYAVSRIELRNILVKEAMVPAITVIKSAGVSECASLMRKSRIDQIPVVSSSQKLIGMIRDKDIVKALVDHSQTDSRRSCLFDYFSFSFSKRREPENCWSRALIVHAP